MKTALLRTCLYRFGLFTLLFSISLSVFKPSVYAQSDAVSTIFLPLVASANSTKPATVPAINRFTADPATITIGGQSTLHWDVTGATSVSISGVGAVTGTSVAVQPTSTTTYVLTARNSGGSVTAQATVTVAANSGGGGNRDVTSFLLPYRLGDTYMTSRVPQVAVDANDGIHAVYAANAPQADGVRPAYYAYCPVNCTSTASFSTVALGDSLGEAQLALDSAGHPRVLLTSEGSDSIQQYVYGECNAQCTNATHWTLVTVAQGKASFFPSQSENNQSFALDPQGHPRFIYYGNSFGADPNDAGLFYVSCDGNCTDATNWVKTKIGDADIKNPALAFTPAGQPRLLYAVNSGAPNYEPSLVYTECDSDCTAIDNWSYTVLLVTTTSIQGSNAVFALRVDSAGQLRVVLYPGTGNGGNLTPNRLYYLTCNANCLTLANWNVIAPGLPEQTNDQHAIYNGDFGVDLALDQQGHPRIAYRLGYGVDELGYTWCDANCDTNPASWHYLVIPTTAATEQELGLPPREGCPDCVPPIPPCPSAFYDAGYWPSLTMNAVGKPRIIFEVQLKSGGGGCTAGTRGRFPRLVIFDQP